MILCIGATPAMQRVMVFPKVKADAVNRAITTLDGAAGKAVNVAKVLKVLGDDPVVTGFVGDIRGQQLRSLMAAQEVASDFLEVPAPTRECVTVIDQEAGSVTELVQESQPVAARDYDRLSEIIARHLPRAHAVVMSGTITPGGPTDFYLRCAQQAKAAGALVVIDAQGPLLLQALSAEPDLVKPNRTELAASVGRQLVGETEVIEAMQELRARGPHRVVVTDGAKPTLAYDGTGSWRIHAAEIQALNPIGSGDAFTAGLVSCLVRGDDLGEACRWGAAAGAANALTWMAGEVRLDDVRRILAGVHLERIN